MDCYDTKLLDYTIENARFCAELIKNGEVVGIPTETVYGLGGNALCEKTVEKIFKAKGRPSDNPLIVHIYDVFQAEKIAKNISPLFYKLAEKFWPGPLTMIVEKKDIIPYTTSGGLETVGLRVPSHPIARKIIELSELPIAAPSGNISGKPSPTSAGDMLYDMNGKIPAIIDGGACEVGLESTVITFENDGVRILRPGKISAENLSQICPVFVDDAVINKIEENTNVSSPGMKYKHYSPEAKVILIDANFNDFCSFAKQEKDEKTFFVLSDNECENADFNTISYGKNYDEFAKNLFSILRELDKREAKIAYFQLPNKCGVGLAIYNRLIRAAGYEVKKPH